MEPITTALAAVSAASNAIAYIKARINDVQSVADISDQIGTLFNAQKKLNEERNKQAGVGDISFKGSIDACLLYTSPSPRDGLLSRMPSSA